PQGLLRVEKLEDRLRIVCETADNGQIEIDELAEPHRVQSVENRAKPGRPCVLKAIFDLSQTLDRAQRLETPDRLIRHPGVEQGLFCRSVLAPAKLVERLVGQTFPITAKIEGRQDSA